MLALRLVRLIETHSNRLAAHLMEQLITDPRTSDMRKVPRVELEDRTYEIYHNLSKWLLYKTEDEIERRYMELGERRAAQGVSFAHFFWALVTTKEVLWNFLQGEGFVDNPVELLGELELLRLFDQFFDRALYYALLGYQQREHAQQQALHRPSHAHA
jgi:hypothetical protein